MSYNPLWAVTRGLIYGDGSDGALSTAGSTASSPHFYTTIAVTAGTYNIACFHVYGSGTATLTGTLGTTNGNAGSGTTGGAIVAAGTLPGAPAGQNGAIGATNSTVGTTGIGLTGGTGGGGIVAGGNQAAGATSTVYSRCQEAFLAAALNGVNSGTGQCAQVTFGGGASGGRGSGIGGVAGGGSGSQGGSLFLAVKTLVNGGGTGVITGTGGNGGNGAAAEGGGGGGGGSGSLVVADTGATAITPTLTPGNGGTGITSGGNGVAGSALGVTCS